MKSMKFIKWPFVYILLALSITISCSKEGGAGDDPDSLTEEEILELLATEPDIMPQDFYDDLESLPVTTVDEGEILLPNGLLAKDFNIDLDGSSNRKSISASDAKNAIVKRLTVRAVSLTLDEFFQYPQEDDDEPAQDGLAFVYGSKSIAARDRFWAGGIYPICDDKLYGLDCSGYISNVFQLAGLPIPHLDADRLRQEANITSALKAAYPELKLQVDNLGAAPPSEWQSGDIVYWLKEDGVRADHIGMLIQHGGGLVLANSSGSPTSRYCDYNQSKEGGPVLRDFSTASSRILGAKYGYRIVRFNVLDSKKIYLRCADQSFDVFETEISLNLDENYSDSFTTVVADYDGEIFNAEFVILYESASRSLTVDFSIEGGTRVDRVVFSLDSDDTGYVPMTKIVDNGGCVAAMRIVDNSAGNVTSKSRSSTSGVVITGVNLN